MRTPETEGAHGGREMLRSSAHGYCPCGSLCAQCDHSCWTAACAVGAARNIKHHEDYWEFLAAFTLKRRNLEL